MDPNSILDAAGVDQFADDYAEDRPSFGQRIAQKAPVQQSPDNARAKVSGTQIASDSTPPAIQFDPQKLPSGILRTTPTPSEIPSPAASSPANTTLPGLIKQRSEIAQPINPSQPKYRMGMRSRIFNTIGNFATGFAGDKSAPVYVGPGATNRAYGRDVAMQQSRLGAIDTDIGNQEKLAGIQEKGYEDAIKQAYEGQLGESREKLASAAEERARLYGELGTEKNENERLKLGQGQQKLDMNSPEGRAEAANQYGLKGQARTDYILTGKLPKDMLGSTRNPTELETWMAAFRRDNGREPTADEIAQRKSNRSSEADKITADRDKALEKAEQKAEQRISKLKIFDPTDNRPIEQRKQAIYADLEKEKAAAVRDYQERAGQLSASRPGPKSAPGTPKTSPKAPPKSGETINVGGKPFMVTGYNAKTKKPIGYYVNQ